jgi:pyrroloquinoline quinone biosynthesis protein E
MPPSNPLLLIAELSYKCPLHCPYCSNPLSIGSSAYRNELATEDWNRAIREASDLGVLQLALTGGEPLVRKDVEELARVSRETGIYSSLITAGTPFTRSRAEALKEAGLDHVQISIQDSDPIEADRIAGTKAFSKKIDAAKLARELGFPLTINVVLHRQNLDRIETIIELAVELGAVRLELANTQYQGWAAINTTALMPTHEQLAAGEAAVIRARERLGASMQILWVLPDYYEEFPKPCMGGWGSDAILITPNGDVMPCQAAASIPGMVFDNIREKSLSEIWFESEAFERFRGTAWMPEPCRSCPLDRQEIDFGGCRCQALALTGDPANVDPVCTFSPHHKLISDAVEAAQRIPIGDGRLIYRSTTPSEGSALADRLPVVG